MKQQIHHILKKHWGYDSFRPLQEDIILSVLEGKDTLGLMPTGGGKSITFQVPSLVYPDGVSIVVTPLVSLMKDQVDNLKKHNVKAVYFHSGMSRKEVRDAWEKIFKGRARLIYIAPERLGNDKFMLEIRQLKVNMIVVDEAHCISQWGYDFRPSYLNIPALRKLKPDAPVLALTATATPEVAQDLMEQLKFSTKNLFSKSFVRENISYVVRKTGSKIHEILHILSRTSGTAIVYVRSRKRCKEVSDYLNSADISSTFYHAGLDHSLKEERQNSWKMGGFRVMVATNAFGMGIDKADVRVVIHYDVPPSLEEYYQEAGRAGRDGKGSYAVLLISNTDKALLKRRVTEAFPERKFIREIYENVCNNLHLSIGEGYDKIKEFNIEKFCRLFEYNQKYCRSALRILSQAGYMQFIEEPDSRSRVKVLVDREELYNLCEINDSEEKLLILIMRLYTGLFTDYVYIREEELCTRLGLSNEEIYNLLLSLDKKKIIDFIPRSSLPIIYMPTSREEKKNIIIGNDIYEERKNAMNMRIEKMIEYAFKENECRVAGMLAYFGEKDACDCGKCDVCRRKQKSGKGEINDEKLIEELLSLLKKSPRGLSWFNISTYFGKYSERIKILLSNLCNEGFIELNEGLFHLP